MDNSCYMKRALELASLGKGLVAPNPMVGCVIVHTDKIIGEGFHQIYGGPHAEVNAINQVKNQELLKESVVYVTLEPCVHDGKTPPCDQLLIKKQVRKVVIACIDTFAQVNGKGVKKLQAAGIEVQIGLMEKQARELNNRFFTSNEQKRPFVILKWAQTQDGFLARENFDSKWISNPYSRQLVHKWRAEEDAILIGKNTALYDNPSLTTREWHSKNPIRVVLDRHLEVRQDASVFNSEAQTLIFNTIKEGKNENIVWIKTAANEPWEVLKQLHDRKIQSVLIEGGAQVLNTFIEKNCWDEARIFISPQKFGKGMNAPKISETKKDKIQVFNDQLIYYQNNYG